MHMGTNILTVIDSEYFAHGAAGILKLCGKIPIIVPSEPSTYQWPWLIFKVTWVMTLSTCYFQNLISAHNDARFMKFGGNIPIIEVLEEFLYQWPWSTFKGHMRGFQNLQFLDLISAHNWSRILTPGGTTPTIVPSEPFAYGWPWSTFQGHLADFWKYAVRTLHTHICGRQQFLLKLALDCT